MPPYLPLLLGTFISAALHIYFDSRRNSTAIYVLKPLTMLLIIGLAATMRGTDERYHILLLCGLAASLTGDIFLMLRNRRFTPGLACFLVAHLFYCAAFIAPPAFATAMAAVTLTVSGLFMFRFLLADLGSRRVPVALYMAVILCMLLAAINRWVLWPAWQTGVTAAGAGLFLLSDSFLAVRQFRRDFPHAQMLILSTYYAAQVCIALGQA